MCTMCKYNVPGGRTAYGLIPVLALERQAPRASGDAGGFPQDRCEARGWDAAESKDSGPWLAI